MSTDSTVFRANGISYMRIPSKDLGKSSTFYQTVFGWKVGGKPESPSFADGTGHVIGEWVTDLRTVGEAGVIPYIYVERVRDSLKKILENGGEIVRDPYPEGDLWVATFRDPSGNVLGIWQRGSM